MRFKKKIVLIFLFLSTIYFGGFYYSNQASASGFAGITTVDIPRVVEYIKHTIVRVMARELLTLLSNTIVDKIQGNGRGGGPSFVQNWRNFITDAQYRGEDIFKTILASTPVCGYLNKSIKDAFRVTDNQNILFKGNNIRVGDLDPFNLRAACTLPSGFNMDAYRNDFAGNGGWDAWSRLLEPQNNYYGLLLSSLDELGKQRDLSQAADIAEVASGKGYTSIRDGCQDAPKDPNFTGPTMPAYSARCTFMGKVFTPGDLLGQSVASSIDTEFKGIITSQDIADLAVNIIGAVVSRISNLGGSESNDTSVDPEVNKFSYVEEYCVAKKPTGEAVAYVKQNYPDLATKFPTTTTYDSNPVCDALKLSDPVTYEIKCANPGISYCSTLFNNDNPYPNMKCTQDCMKAGGAYAMPNTPTPIPSVIPCPDKTGCLELPVCKGTQSEIANGNSSPYVGTDGTSCTLETGKITCLKSQKILIPPGTKTASEMQKLCRVSFCTHTHQSSQWWGWADQNRNDHYPFSAAAVDYFCKNNLGWFGFDKTKNLPTDATICSALDSSANGYIGGGAYQTFSATSDNPLQCEAEQVAPYKTPYFP